MVGYALLFGVLALFAAAFGYGGLAGESTDLAQLLFVLCLCVTITLLLLAQVKRLK